MKYTTYLAFSLLSSVLLLAPACMSEKKEAASQEAAAAEPTFRLVNVDSADLFKDAHIPGAINLNFEQLDEQTKGWSKKTPVILYCSDYTCGTSHTAAKKLKELGFEDVSVYAGGMNEWVKKHKENKDQYPVEGDAKQEYLTKEVAPTAAKEGEAPAVTAEDLSKKLAELKK